MRKIILFSILLLLFCASIPCFAAVTKVQEDSTDLLFDKVIKFSDEAGAPDVVCIGAGVRKKAIIKVYGAAIYLEPVEAKKVLAKYVQLPQGKDMEDFIEEIYENAGFWKDFIGGNFHKVIVMRFVRDVGTGNISGAYKDAFTSYLKDNSPETKKDVETFLQFFNEDIKEGQDMTLRIAPNGTIIVEYAGKLRGQIVNANIAKALLTNWFGDDPISENIKENGIKYIVDSLK